MTDPQPKDYSDEPDLPADTIIELTSLAEDGPLSLEEGDKDPATWPQPPEEWEINRHAEEYKVDPDTTIGMDNSQDEPEQFEEQETPV